MTNTPNLELPEIAADQAMKHVTHNEALMLLDAIVQLSVRSRTVTDPTGESPVSVDGDRYIVPPIGVSPEVSEDWTGENDNIAVLVDGAWQFITPKVGWRAHVQDEDVIVRWDGSAWVDGFTAAQLRSILGIESGTWTPVLTFLTPGDLSVGYATQEGVYTRIGNLYFCTFRIITSSFTHTTASGALRVSGLPAAVAVGTGYRFSLDSWQGITKTNYTQIGGSLSGTAIASFPASGSGQANSNVQVGDVPSGGAVRLIGTAVFEAA